MTVIAFSQPAMPIIVLAADKLPNKVIISERADPNRLMKKRYGKPFIEKYYTRADVAVFQTPNAVLSFQVSTKCFDRIDAAKSDLPLEPDIVCDNGESLSKTIDLIK